MTSTRWPIPGIWPLCALVPAALLLGANSAAPPPFERPKPVAPQPMPTLPPATLDDTLAIAGEDIEARKLASRMTASVRVNGTGPYRFVVDSGADTSVVSTRLAGELKLPLATPIVMNGMTESAIVQRVQVESLGLGSTTVTDKRLPVLLERDLGADGMIGIDALVEQRLMLDFEKRLITIEDARRPMPRAEGEVVIVARRRRGQLILTQVTANGNALDAVIDTGSEITIGNTALRDLLIRRQLDKYTATVEIIGVTGRPMTLQLARIGELRLGSVVFRDILIAFADLPPFEVFGLSKQPSLLLGTDLMEQFRRVSLDFRARRVRFQLRRCDSMTFGVRMSFQGSRIAPTTRQNEACRR